MGTSLRQRTFTVQNQKVQIKSRQRTSMGNHCGFHVWVNGTKYYINALKRQDAEDKAYAKWVKAQARTVVFTFDVSTIEDFGVYGWTQFVESKAGAQARVAGARCKDTTYWYDPHDFSHGHGCLRRVQQAMRDGVVELQVMCGA